MMKISLGSDHGGVDYKNKVKDHLELLGYDVIDVGTMTHDSCNYPEFAEKAAKLVADGTCRYGIVFCTSGEGVCIVANKIKGIRCGIGYCDDVTRLLREHNDANMVAFSQGFMDYSDVERRVDLFISTAFSGGRHQTRVDMISDLEK